MAEKADIIVENFRMDVKHRLGVDYESVRKVNPAIIYGSISGFGLGRPRRRRFDIIRAANFEESIYRDNS